MTDEHTAQGRTEALPARLTIRLPATVRDELHRRAHGEGLTTSELVRRLLIQRRSEPERKTQEPKRWWTRH
jgi:hypothetical protein